MYSIQSQFWYETEKNDYLNLIVFLKMKLPGYECTVFTRQAAIQIQQYPNRSGPLMFSYEMFIHIEENGR